MLKSLSLRNFRGFKEHRVDFSREAILIGRNNAGKTTIIEALRVLSVCQSRVRTAPFLATPEWLNGHCSGAGFKPSLETIDFDYANVQHGYDTELPATIKAKLTQGHELCIYIGRGPGEIFCQIKRSGREIVHTRPTAENLEFGITKVMPPIGSLLPREKIIAKDRLGKYRDGYLAYRHFRNQLWENPSSYRLFQTMLEETWHGLKIDHFENDHGENKNEFSLLVREGRFTSEVSWHGHGLQAWMQTIWFLSRTDRRATIVLDEPDVYLHADLQRKLIKAIENLRFRQAVVATHSPEIISDVPFQNVIVVQKRDAISRASPNAAAIQEALRGMGSIHSIQLSKLASRGLLLLVEGNDRLFLSEIAYKLGIAKFDCFSEVAVQEIDGRGNWQRALGAAESLSRASGGDVKAILLLDSDYFAAENHEDKILRGAAHNLKVKIWARKEIENYFLIPEAIARYVTDQSESGTLLSVTEARNLISVVANELTQGMIECIADEIKNAAGRTGKGMAVTTALAKAREEVSKFNARGILLEHLVSGKQAISKLSKICKDDYGVSFNALSICKEAKLLEISPEMREFVESLCVK